MRAARRACDVTVTKFDPSAGIAVSGLATDRRQE